MPPKAKFTKEEVAKTALGIIKEKGLNGLTARNLASKLGTSSRPIFTVFKNMEEVKLSAREVAMNEFEQYANEFGNYSPAFKQIGMKMIDYAMNKPELYKLLFMQEYSEKRDFEKTLLSLGDMVDVCLDIIEQDYKMERAEAKILFEQMWLYTFGIGVFCAMNVCNFTEDEISEKLSQVFAGMVMTIK